MYKTKNTFKKEIIITFAAFTTIVLITIFLQTYNLKSLKFLHKTTETIYNHPLEVSNASLNVKLHVLKIHRDMKDIVLTPKNISDLTKKVDNNEKNIYIHFKTIEEKILGEKGKELYKKTKRLYDDWKPIRNEVISLVHNGNLSLAIDITKNKGAEHVKKLEKHAEILHKYARNKADGFKNDADNFFTKIEENYTWITITISIVFLVIMIYILRRAYNYHNKINKNKKELEKANFLLNESQKISSTGSWELNHITNELTWSNQVYVIFGVKPQEFKANYETFLSYIHPDDRETVNKAYANSIKYKKSYKSEHRILLKDGSIKFLQESCRHFFDNNGNIIKSIGNVKDITKQKEQGKLLIQQSKMATMGEMLASIAHQWKQPLSIISMSNGLLRINQEVKDFSTQEEIDDAIHQIDHSIKNLSQTIDDFRNFFNPNKEQTLFTTTNVFNETLKLISSQFKNNDIKIIESIENLELYGSQNELQQTLINLIKNAKEELVKKDSSENKYLFLDVYKDKDNVIIKIKDNAGGVPSNILPHVFDSYFTTKEKTGGTGIGLYMSKQIIEGNMKGKIDVKNEEYIYEGNKYFGAEFTIEIPLI